MTGRVHRLRHLLKAQDVQKVDECPDEEVLRRNELFKRLLQSLIFSGPMTEEFLKKNKVVFRAIQIRGEQRLPRRLPDRRRALVLIAVWALLGILRTTGGETVADSVHRGVGESLNRGLVALRSAEGVYLSWRLLPGDPAGLAFHLYRQEEGASATGGKRSSAAGKGSSASTPEPSLPLRETAVSSATVNTVWVWLPNP